MLRAYFRANRIRKKKVALERALAEYPLYDPPHKVEERLLSKEKAAENFDYFMRVRQQRIAYFRGWVQRHFRVAVTLDEPGIRALSQWGSEYAGFLLVRRTDRPYLAPTLTYFTYDPPWAGENAGHNVLIDMGMVLGEAIIAHGPQLRCDCDPISAVLPRLADSLRRDVGTGFQRPMLTGFDNPAFGKTPLYDVYGFGDQMMKSMTTLAGLELFYRAISNGLRDGRLTTCRQTHFSSPVGP